MEPKTLNMSRTRRRIFTLLACALVLSCKSPSAEVAAPTSAVFQNPQRVAIEGYDGDAMEPFLSRDGKYLFFSNLNEPGVNTNLHWAERIDDLHFKYRGEIKNVNTPALEGVASLDRSGNFYFVSNRSYDKTASTLYRGKFADGVITGIELVPGVSLAKPGIVNFDAEISADGETLYFVESQFSWRGQPKSARILFARRVGNTFVRDGGSEAILKTVNTDRLTYAPATSVSECELFFTRVDADGPAIYWAKRTSKTLPFDAPARLSAITGFVEGPTLSPDEKSLYYHKKEEGHLVLPCHSTLSHWRVVSKAWPTT
jgi:hypothetical protein